MKDEGVEREFRRKKRVANMLVTAHSILGERYRKISIAFDIVLMLTSFLILLLSIVDLAAPNFLAEIDGGWANAAMAAGAATIFVLSVIEWRISWKGRSESHFHAARSFSTLKGEISALLAKGVGEDDVNAGKIEDRYEKLSLSCISIPHKKFVKLKRQHLKKVAISKLLDEQPFANALVIRIRLALSDTAKGWSSID